MILTRADGQVERPLVPVPPGDVYHNVVGCFSIWSAATPLILPGLPELRAFAAATSGAWCQKTLE